MRLSFSSIWCHLSWRAEILVARSSLFYLQRVDFWWLKILPWESIPPFPWQLWGSGPDLRVLAALALPGTASPGLTQCRASGLFMGPPWLQGRPLTWLSFPGPQQTEGNKGEHASPNQTCAGQPAQMSSGSEGERTLPPNFPLIMKCVDSDNLVWCRGIWTEATRGNRWCPGARPDYLRTKGSSVTP